MKISSLRWQDKEISEYWDKRAMEVGSLTAAPSTAYYRNAEIRLIKKYFNILTGKRFLKLDLWNEVNNTQILFWITEQKAKVYGLDISSYLVKETKKLFAEKKLKGEFVIADMRKIKFPNNFFDYVYSMGTIEHVPDYDKAIGEIYRILKPKGLALIGVPNKLDPFFRPLVVWLFTKLGKYPYAPEKSFTIWELEGAVKTAGFKIEARTGILFIPGFLRMIDVYFHQKIPIISKFIGLLLKPFDFLEKNFSFFARNGYLIACVCRK